MIEKVLTYVTENEDYYYDIASDFNTTGRLQASLLNHAQAVAFQKVRYFIEELKEEESEGKN